MRNLHLPFFLCLLVSSLFLSCRSFKEPEFRGIENVRVSELGIKESNLTLDLHYFNLNKSSLSLKEAEGDAWLDGSPLGHFIIDTLIQIPANADFGLPVKLKMDMNYFLRNTFNAFINKDVLVKIEGKARVGKGGIFIRYPIHYEGKQNFSELMK
jgi:LEA14-like dessication related protein